MELCKSCEVLITACRPRESWLYSLSRALEKPQFFLLGCRVKVIHLRFAAHLWLSRCTQFMVRYELKRQQTRTLARGIVLDGHKTIENNFGRFMYLLSDFKRHFESTSKTSSYVIVNEFANDKKAINHLAINLYLLVSSNNSRRSIRKAHNVQCLYHWRLNWKSFRSPSRWFMLLLSF